jgi:hypothetical protein
VRSAVENCGPVVLVEGLGSEGLGSLRRCGFSLEGDDEGGVGGVRLRVGAAGGGGNGCGDGVGVATSNLARVF